MPLIQTILTVRSDEVLEKAIAAEMSTDDNNLTESFLNEMSVNYPHYNGKRKLVVENPDEQAGNIKENCK